MGTRYFNGVYEPNNKMHVLENPFTESEPKNYYAQLQNARTSEKKSTKVAEIFDKFILKDKPVSVKTEDDKNYLLQLREMQSQKIFSKLQYLLQRIMSGEIKIPEKKSDLVDALVNELNRKTQSKN